MSDKPWYLPKGAEKELVFISKKEQEKIDAYIRFLRGDTPDTVYKGIDVYYSEGNGT